MIKKELLELVKIIDISYLDIKYILELTEDEKEYIFSKKDIKNIKYIARFLVFYKQSEKKNNYLRDNEVKELILDKIITSDDDIYAEYILRFFDYQIDKFKTKDEYLIYLKHILEGAIINNHDLCYVLEKVTKRRREVLDKTLMLPKSISLINSFNNYDLMKFDGQELLDYLDLIAVNYNKYVSYDFIKKSKRVINSRKSNNSTEKYLEVLNYLKKPLVFHYGLPYVFTRVSCDEYENVIAFLSKVSDNNILEQYVIADINKNEEKILRMYIDSVLEINSQSLRQAHINLLVSGEIVKILENSISDDKELAKKQERIILINDKLKSFDDGTGKSIVMSELYKILPIETWSLINPSVDMYVLLFIVRNQKIVKLGHEIILELTNLSLDELIYFSEFISCKSFNIKVNRKDYILNVLKNRKAVSIEEICEQYKNKEIELTNQNQQLFVAANTDYIAEILREYSDTDEIKSDCLVYKK